MKKLIPLISILFWLPVVLSCNSTAKKTNADVKPWSSKIFNMTEMNTQQIKSLDKNNTVILLMGGILEEHVPYLPAYTDGYWNEKFADTLAQIITTEKNLNVLLFPAIPLGNSGANDIGMKYSFPGAYTVRFETLRSVFVDLAIELGEQGV
jgi:creatinine amidohydrolase/Fe(II)-dependent formamide hydrolase-like protein